MIDEKLFKSRPVKEAFYHPQVNPRGFYMAPVDIIIPFHGEHGRVSRLVESIFSTVRTNRYQISLVDDGSPNENFVKEFKNIPGVVTFRSKEQKGFGSAVNLGLKNTKQPFVLILHSDVVVSGNTWLFNLGVSLNAMRDDAVRMVSPLTDNSLGDESLRGLKNKTSVDRVMPEGSFLPMYCVLCSRGLFSRVGELKEFPYYAGGEAEEFAVRMFSKGYRQGICGSSWVHHDGRGTLRNYDNNKRVQEELRKYRENLSQTNTYKDDAISFKEVKNEMQEE